MTETCNLTVTEEVVEITVSKDNEIVLNVIETPIEIQYSDCGRSSSSGLPTGGDTDQFLKKNSSADDDASWVDLTHDKIVEKYRAGESITAYQPVVIENGSLFVADNVDVSHTGKLLGLALQSGIAGNEIKIIRQGSVSNGGWSFSVDDFIYLGANGLLTNTAPLTGFLQSIGHAQTTNTIILNIKQAIRRI